MTCPRCSHLSTEHGPQACCGGVLGACRCSRDAMSDKPRCGCGHVEDTHCDNGGCVARQPTDLMYTDSCGCTEYVEDSA